MKVKKNPKNKKKKSVLFQVKTLIDQETLKKMLKRLMQTVSKVLVHKRRFLLSLNFLQRQLKINSLLILNNMPIRIKNKLNKKLKSKVLQRRVLRKRVNRLQVVNWETFRLWWKTGLNKWRRRWKKIKKKKKSWKVK